MNYRSTPDVIIQVASLAEARNFYAKALGLSVTNLNDRMLQVDTGSFPLFVEEGKSPGPVFEFLVDDVQAAKAELLQRGCMLVDENPKVPRCYLRDPFGLTFNLGKR